MPPLNPRDPLRPAVFGRFRIGGTVGTPPPDELEGYYVIAEDGAIAEAEDGALITWEAAS